jgi:hypothetical protein
LDNGLLSFIDNGISRSDYTYDVRNQLTSETQTLFGRAAKIVSYEYDADGLRTVLGYPTSPVVTYQWTARAQLQNVSADGPPPLATYTYDKAVVKGQTLYANFVTHRKPHHKSRLRTAKPYQRAGT